MSASSPMKRLAAGGHRPHPRLALYYANRRTFTNPGIHLWIGKRHVRLLPLPKAGA